MPRVSSTTSTKTFDLQRLKPKARPGELRDDGDERQEAVQREPDPRAPAQVAQGTSVPIEIAHPDHDSCDPRHAGQPERDTPRRPLAISDATETPG